MICWKSLLNIAFNVSLNYGGCVYKSDEIQGRLLSDYTIIIDFYLKPLTMPQFLENLYLWFLPENIHFTVR